MNENPLLPVPKETKEMIEGIQTLQVLSQIQNKTLSPKQIGREDRILIVQFLISDGYSTPEIAKILEVSDKTIERDKKRLRETTTLTFDPKLLEQFAGRIVAQAELSTQKIRKLLRGKESDLATCVDAESRCFEIEERLIRCLQSLGLLPNAVSKIESRHLHLHQNAPSLEDTGTEIRRLQNIYQSEIEQNEGDVQSLQKLNNHLREAQNVREMIVKNEAPLHQEGDEDEPDSQS